MRSSMITAGVFAALSTVALCAPVAAAPIGPGSGLAVPADAITTVQMDRMERHAMRRHMRHRMERRMMRRHMRHRMQRRMMHRM